MALFKPNLPHFVTGDFKPQHVFLADDDYGRALDCLVKACSDFLILEGSAESESELGAGSRSDPAACRVMLGKRIVEPQPDWWFMGGRMRPGEKPEESVLRLLSRELGIKADASSIRLLGVHSYAWYRRQQPPMEHGTCDISAVFTLTLPRGIAQGIKLDPKEYSETRWCTVDEIIDGEHFHPALRQSARDLKSRFLYDALQSAIQRGASDAEVAAAAKALIQSQ